MVRKDVSSLEGTKKGSSVSIGCWFQFWSCSIDKVCGCHDSVKFIRSSWFGQVNNPFCDISSKIIFKIISYFLNKEKSNLTCFSFFFSTKNVPRNKDIPKHFLCSHNAFQIGVLLIVLLAPFSFVETNTIIV